MEFKTPLFLLLIPALIGLWFYKIKKAKDPAFLFSSLSLIEQNAISLKARLSFLPWALRVAALFLFIIALAGPRLVSQEMKVTSEGIDIVLAVDVSGSMAAEDFKIKGERKNRLDVVKGVVEEFIDERKSDRIALIAFGARAYTACPLTTDHAWLKENLKRLHLGMVEDGTAIGSGISSGILRLKNSNAKSKIIVVLTDGANNAGKIAPVEAAKMAKTLGIKIYAIGAGSKGVVPFPVVDMFGRKMYQNVQIDIDEEEMQEIAKISGGKYFRATDTDSLRDVYKEINRLEKTQIEESGYKHYHEIFGIFLWAGLCALLLELLLKNTWLLRIP